MKQAFRLMWRQPILTATATTALALGIGLLTVAAATVEALLFSQLPFDGGERFVLINAWQEPEHRPATLAPADYALIATRATTLAHVGAASQNRENITLPSGQVQEATTAALTPTSLRFLPYNPILGRRLTAADAAPGAPAVVMIREAFWRRAFGGRADVVGATLDVGGVRRTVVGVMPNDFQFPSRPPDLWAPLGETFREGRAALAPNERLFGILTPASTIESAQAELSALSPQVTGSRGGRVVRLDATSVTDLGPQAPVMASAIIAVVIAILVVVAANVSNLVLARSLLRARELAVRTALGASRARLVGQITMEVLLLCALAALVGSIAAQAALRQFNAIDDLPFWLDFTAGPRTVLLVVGATLVASAIAGGWPALRITRGQLLPSLQSGSERGSDVHFGRAAAVMVIVQIAVSVVMLHGALVFTDSLRRYAGSDVDLPTNVLTTGLRFGATRVPGGRAVPAATRPQDVVAVAAALPGVTAAGLTTALPRHSPPASLVEIEPLSGERASGPRPAPAAEVSERFFATLDAAPVAGRLFVSSDYTPGAAAAVVNVPFVQTFLGGAAPLGRRFRTIEAGRPGSWHEIVGVVRDLGLSVGDPAFAAGYYLPLLADRPPGRWVYLSMRVAGDPIAYVNPLRRALYERDPTVVLNRPERLEDVAGEDRAFFLWFSRALVGLGAVTLVLALTGVYAMMSLIVTRRTRELGVRVALGATTSRIVGSVIGRAAWQLALGGALGGVLAVLSLDLRSVLVSRLGDGGRWTLPAVLALLIVAGLCATALPLRRALRVQPTVAMRVE